MALTQSETCVLVASAVIAAFLIQRRRSDPVVEAAKRGLAQLCHDAGIDDSHGIGHALKVLGHLDRALSAATEAIPSPRAQACRLAALLHDADDKKYFPKTAKTYANARAIMARAGAPAPVIDDALRQISWVSCSANGNSCPPEAKTNPELLWPRWADRLEAVGDIGIVRCYAYNKHEGKTPLACAETPRPQSAEEALALATSERFEQYQASGGGSKSMLDHYYDKLLQVARPPPSLVRNAYLEAEALAGAQPLLEVCLAFGRTAEVPVAMIEATAHRLGFAC